jgi:signal peptidase I
MSMPADDPPRNAVSTDRRSENATGEDERPPERSRRRRFFGSTPFLVLLALVIAVLVKSFLIQAFYIPSPSMEPTLLEGDRVFVNKVEYDVGDVHRGDVIVFANPRGPIGPDRGVIGGFLHWLGEGIGVAHPASEDFIKRVVGLPGEQIQLKDHAVYVNGSPLAEPYLTSAARQCNNDYGPITVPAGRLFVLGDNRCNSLDSRYGLGYVPLDRVIGKAFFIVWPPSQIGGVG